MKLRLKITLKIVLTFFLMFLLLEIAMVVFNFRETVFRSFLFEHPELVSLFTIPLASLTAYLGYVLARNKNKNPKKWAILCFFLNIWGLIVLSFLPVDPKSNVNLGNRISKP